MESIGDILKGIATQPRQAGYVPETKDLEECPVGVCRGHGWVTGDLPTSHPDFGKVFPCDCQKARIEAARTERLMRYSGLDDLADHTFGNFKVSWPPSEPEPADAPTCAKLEVALAGAQEYAQKPEGWLVLTGPTGTGKTHLAAAIANVCIADGRAVHFANVPNLIDHLRESFGPDSDLGHTALFEQVRNAPILVLDELTDGDTAWSQTKLKQLVNHRYNGLLPTVVTTQEIDGLDPYVQTRIRSSSFIANGRILATAPEPTSLERNGIGEVPTEMLASMTFDSFKVRHDIPLAEASSQRHALETARGYAKEVSDRPWLTFIGEPGVGKTHLAAAIAGDRVRAGLPVFFIQAAELTDRLLSGLKADARVPYQKLREEIVTAQLLILDDLGAEPASEWNMKTLSMVVNLRHAHRLPTIITSNLDFTQLPGGTASRICDRSIGQVVKLSGPDHRRGQ